MTDSVAIDLGRQAIFVTLVVCAPALIIGLLVGLSVSFLQAITQIQEPTLTFIPKIVVISLSVLFFGPFMLAMLTTFTAHVFTSIPRFTQ